MPDLQAAVEDWIASLPEPEFRTLVVRTRPPDEPRPHLEKPAAEHARRPR
jgi:hypothetical protein